MDFNSGAEGRLYIQNLIVRPHIMLAAGSILCFLNIRIPLGSFLLQITNFLSISVFRVIGLRTMAKAFGMILKFFFKCFINNVKYQLLEIDTSFPKLFGLHSAFILSLFGFHYSKIILSNTQMNFSTLFLLFSSNVYVTNFNVIIYNVRHTRNRMKYSMYLGTY